MTEQELLTKSQDFQDGYKIRKKEDGENGCLLVLAIIFFAFYTHSASILLLLIFA